MTTIPHYATQVTRTRQSGYFFFLSQTFKGHSQLFIYLFIKHYKCNPIFQRVGKRNAVRAFDIEYLLCYAEV